MAKKIIISIIIIVLLVVVVYNVAFKKEEQEFELVEVVKGNVVQEISETGQVQKGDKISLSFKSAGTIEKIYAEVGQDVKKGTVLAKLETTNLSIQLKEAESSLGIYQAELDKLLAGASPEKIKIDETAVENKEIALDTAYQGLEDANGDALNDLNSAYLKAYNAQNEADSIRRTYFKAYDQARISFETNQKKIESSVSQIKSSIDSINNNLQQEEIDFALSQTKIELSNISDALKNMREICEEPNYRDIISSTDKTSLETHLSNINTALTDITDAQQAITSAQFSIISAQGNLQAAKDDLSLTIASARQEDIDLYQAQVSKSQAQVDNLENKIYETSLRSPVQGQITEIKKRVGELVQSAVQDIVITLLPFASYEIEVDIYEEDVVKVKIGNSVDISLVAFPDKKFLGKVVSIDPAEKLVEGVVYYEISINFEEIPEGIKPGMTADLVIKTALKENVLVIPEDAIQKKEGKIIVEVFQEEKIEEREVKIGLEGSDDMVEVVLGVKEGEKIILR